MIRIWKITNLIILFIQSVICLLGTFYKHIAFGWGLGDILWYGLMYLLLFTHLVLSIKGKKKTKSYFQILTTIFLVTTIFICLQATIWRDVEYPWNGKIFYDN